MSIEGTSAAASNTLAEHNIATAETVSAQFNKLSSFGATNSEFDSATKPLGPYSSSSPSLDSELVCCVKVSDIPIGGRTPPAPSSLVSMLGQFIILSYSEVIVHDMPTNHPGLSNPIS